MQNRDFRIRLTSLYGSQTSSVVLSIHNSVLSTRIKGLCGFQPTSVVLCRQKWGPALNCGFVLENSDFRTRLTSLYGSQTSSVVLSTHNSVLSTRIERLYWFHTSPVVLCMQNSDFKTRFTSFCGSKTPHVVFECKTTTSGAE